MPRNEIMPRVVAAVAAVLAAAPGVARADDARTGGASGPSRPVISALACSDGQPRCVPGGTLTLEGKGLRDVQVVTFLGRRGSEDDRRARPTLRENHLLTVGVPSRARTGRVRVTSREAGSTRSGTRVLILSGAARRAAPAAATGDLYAGGPAMVFRYRAGPGAAGQASVEAYRVTDGAVVAGWPVQPGADGVGQVAWDGTVDGAAVPVGRYAFRVSGPAQAAVSAEGAPPVPFNVFDAIFPIRGKHDLGQSPTNGLGGGRGHMGQDMFAACGTRLVAARGGSVTFAGFDSRAGNYIVVTGADRRSYVSMHMQRPSPLRTGQRVLTGQTVGAVGTTGRSSGCHLHFEMWTAPGWRTRGATAVDALPDLARWDAFS